MHNTNFLNVCASGTYYKVISTITVNMNVTIKKFLFLCDTIKYHYSPLLYCYDNIIEIKGIKVGSTLIIEV